jgi:hypothetical protein
MAPGMSSPPLGGAFPGNPVFGVGSGACPGAQTPGGVYPCPLGLKLKSLEIQEPVSTHDPLLRFPVILIIVKSFLMP